VYLCVFICVYLLVSACVRVCVRVRVCVVYLRVRSGPACVCVCSSLSGCSCGGVLSHCQLNHSHRLQAMITMQAARGDCIQADATP